MVVRDRACGEPFAQSGAKFRVLERLAPERAVADAGLCHRAVQIQHADEARPGAAPVGDREDGAAVSEQPGQDVMAVLPDAFSDDERGVRIEGPEDFHAHFLGIDETMALGRIPGVRTDQFPALGLEGAGQRGFHPGLLRPAGLVCA